LQISNFSIAISIPSTAIGIATRYVAPRRRAIDAVLSALRLELSDLYPNAPAPAKAVTVRWNYRDLLLLARRELQVAVIAVAHVLDGEPLNESDRERLLAAHERLAKLTEVVDERPS
jgi:hypothetical protein